MIDKWIEQLKQGRCISEGDLKRLCFIVKNLLMEEANVQTVRSPVTVCLLVLPSFLRRCEARAFFASTYS